MVRQASWLCMVLASVSLGAPPVKKKGPPPPPAPVTEPTPKMREALGPTVLGGLVNATKVQAFRVTDAGGLRPDPAKAIASDFVRGAAGLELDAPALEALRSVLYDEHSYRLGQDVAGCRFVPHLSFQFRAGLDTLEALVSFSCNQVLFVLGKPGGRWVPQGTFDVKPARKQLLALARQALPQDRDIQQLK